MWRMAESHNLFEQDDSQQIAYSRHFLLQFLPKYGKKRRFGQEFAKVILISANGQ